ncbi:unnamed protein product, partial [Closterium sp. NIES-54]
MDCPLQDCVVHVHMRGTLPDQGGSEFMDTRKGGEGEGEGEPLQIGTGEGRGGSEFMDTRKGEEGEGKGAGEPLQIGTGEGRVRGRAGRVEGLGEWKGRVRGEQKDQFTTLKRSQCGLRHIVSLRRSLIDVLPPHPATLSPQLPEALEASIRLMLPGEVALVSSTAQFAFDSFPRPDGVPEGARVQWEVELFGFERPK